MQVLASAFYMMDFVYPGLSWHERVPSASNVADLPSRGFSAKCTALIRRVYKGAVSVAPNLLRAVTQSLVRTAPPSPGSRFEQLPKSYSLTSLMGGGESATRIQA